MRSRLCPGRRHALTVVAIAALIAAAPALSRDARAQAAAAAISGQVSSAEEGQMEGVLVTAKARGSSIAVTVVSDDKGHFAFPADRLVPGNYRLTIRATGYNLDGGNKTVDVAAGTAIGADLKLVKTRKLISQLTNAEWLASAPGADKDKVFLTQCTGCHTLHRVFTSTHDAPEFVQLFKRMSRYSPGSTPTAPQPLLPGPRGERPIVANDKAEGAAKWLASVNLSDTDGFEYPLKPFERVKGRGTHVIITEYDLPRREAQPHDVIVGADGRAWYSDFGNQFIGELDTKTGKVIDHPVPVLKEEQPKGGLDVEFDPSGNIWLSMMYQAGVARLDPKTGKVEAYPFPKEWQSASTQASMVSPNASNVDGKVWTNNQEDHFSLRLDVATGKYETPSLNRDQAGKQVNAYGMPVDLQNNLWLLEFGGNSFGRRDAKTGEVTSWKTPIPGSRPRRGRFDQRNRLWFAEFGGNAFAMFDPANGEFHEWALPTPYSAPYDVTPNHDGSEAWTGSMLSDRVARLDAKSGQIVEYPLPRSTNIRRVFVEESGPRPVAWVGSNHGASIVKVEPLD